jgi:hypothetical protein
MILRIPVVTEAKYPDLKNLCDAKVVGENYADFLRIIDETIEHAKLLHIETVRVTIDPPKFSEWLGKRQAQRLDLLNYADKIHRNPLVQEQPKMPYTSRAATKDRHKNT